jgi:hypothetical protein
MRPDSLDLRKCQSALKTSHFEKGRVRPRAS